MPLAPRRSLQVTSIMKRHISSVFLLLVALISPAHAETKSPIQERADHFLALANAGYQAVYWRKVLKEATGEDISTRAMMEYFKPLMSWLEEQNKGRQIGWE